MAETIILEKILNVKEKEKEDAQFKKAAAVEHFEKAAKELYVELKRKETAESALETAMQVKTTITVIKEQSHYIGAMNSKINTLQSHVQQARTEMEVKQTSLTEAHVEVKKIERLIELRESEAEEHTRKQEIALMDEISIQKFQQQIQNR